MSLWKDLGLIIEALTPPEVKRANLASRDKIDAAISESITLKAKAENARQVIRHRDRLLNADRQWRKAEDF